MVDALMKTYAPQPVAFSHGQGAWLWDEQGNKYLDAVAGVAVCSLGHAHPAIAEALCDQAGKLMHCSNLYEIPLQQRLGEALTAVAGMERVFFGNSGAEANEAAIKLARLYGHHRNIEEPAIIVTEGSFHGRTMATLSATGNRKVQAGFEPLVHGFIRVPYNDLDAIRTVATNSKNVVAVLVEPVQGEGGVNVPDPAYLAGVHQICRENQWLYMLDEIQTGMCRTGKWFAYQHEQAKPDVMTLAKSLGNGMPIGACLARGEAAELFGPGSHGSTYGGNPLASRVALTVIETMQSMGAAERAAALGEQLRNRFHQALDSLPGVVSVRGKGLMLGIELDRPCTELVGLAREWGLLINVTAERVIRLLPPLILSESEAEQLATGVIELVNTFLSEEAR